MPTSCDVLVAGAGPAGAVAACLLARSGLRVRLLDRATFPREKLCGDTVNPGALAILERLDLGAGLERHGLPIRGMLVTGSRGAEVAAEYGDGVRGLSILRRDLDWLLVQQAIAAGASFEPGVLVQEAIVDASGGQRRVTGLRVMTVGGATHDLHAPMTIAADGRRSRLAFTLGLAHHPEHPRRWAIGAYFDDVPQCMGYGEMHIREGRYIGISPVPGGLTNACVVVSEPRGGALSDPGLLLLASLKRDALLADRFAGARMVTAPAVLGPLAVDTRGAGLDGLLLAGDAAGFIDPMTGDGLRFAFRGAELAAGIALRVLRGQTANAAAELELERAREFGGKWRLNRALRAMVASPRAVTWAARGARVCPPLVRRIIRAAGDVPRGER